MQRSKRFLRPGSWLMTLCLLMLLIPSSRTQAATANFVVQTGAGVHGGYMTVSVMIHVDPASRISLAATLTRDDGSVLRDGTVFSQDEGDASLTIDFSLPIDRRMTGKEDSIHISCISDANGQTYSYNQTVPWAIVHEESVSITEPTCASPGQTVLSCTICGYTRDFILPMDPARHDWGKWVSNQDDTHTRTCQYNPSHTQTRHCQLASQVFAPTCLEDGFTRHTCAVCAYEYRDTVVKALGHDWRPWSGNNDLTHTRTCRRDASHLDTQDCRVVASETQPTCTDNGLRVYTCQICGYSYVEPLAPALGHIWGDWTSNDDATHTRICKRDPSHKETEDCSFVDTVVPPSCTQPGYTTHVCTVCAYDFTDKTFPPLLHDWSDWTSNNDGTHTRMCKRDDSHQETESCRIISQVVEPTCTEEGHTDYSCVLCAYGYEDLIVPALGHDWGAWVDNRNGTHSRTCRHDPSHIETLDCTYRAVVIPPTCEKPGLTTHICNICWHAYDDAPTPAMGHDWDSWTSNNDGTHTGICKRNLSHKETEDCSFVDTVVPSTCTQPGYTTHVCTSCAYDFADQTFPPLLHDWSDWTSNNDGTHTRVCKRDANHQETEDCRIISQVMEPTCTEEGYTDYSCILCAYGYEDMIVPALGHDWGPWENNEDGTHTRTCKRDASHKETEKCMLDATVEPPTCIEDGYTDYDCSVCGYGYMDVIVPASGHQPDAWHRVLKPTRYASGKEEQRCAVCDVLLQEQTMPKLSGMRCGNTACIDGPHFRDSIPEVTDKWFSYAVIDLENEGVTEYPLIASNQYRIGSVFVTVSKSDLMVRYQFSIRKYELREEFLTFFSTIDNIRTLDIEKLKADTLIFNQPTALSELPQENGKTILFMRLLLNYDSFDQGIAPR